MHPPVLFIQPFGLLSCAIAIDCQKRLHLLVLLLNLRQRQLDKLRRFGVLVGAGPTSLSHCKSPRSLSPPTPQVRGLVRHLNRVHICQSDFPCRLRSWHVFPKYVLGCKRVAGWFGTVKIHRLQLFRIRQDVIQLWCKCLRFLPAQTQSRQARDVHNRLFP